MEKSMKNRLKKIKNEMDEIVFLTSEAYRYYLQKIVRNISMNYNLKLIFTQNVCTDGTTIEVNPVHPHLMKIKGIAKKTLCVLGQAVHELFHVLYTDFSVLKRLIKQRGYKSSNGAIELLNLSDYRMAQLKDLLNIVEDSAIELRGTNYFIGKFKTAIIISNKNAFDSMPSLNELVNQNAQRLSVIKMAFAMYCIIGKMKGKLQDPELIEIFKKAMPIMDAARLSLTTSDRMDYAMELYELVFPLIEEVEKNHKENDENKEFQYSKSNNLSGNSTPTDDIPDIKDDFQDNNKEKTKKQLNEEDKKGKTSSDTKKDSGHNNKKSNDQSDDNDDTNKDTSSDKTDNDENKDSDQDDANSADKDNNAKDDKQKNDKVDNKNNSNKKNKDQDVDAKENSDDSDDHSIKDDDSDDKNEMDDLDDDLLNDIDDLDAQLDKVKDDAAIDEFNKEEQKKRDKEIADFSKNLTYGDLHKHIKARALRMTGDVTRKDLYDQLYGRFSGLTKNLIKNIKEVIRYNEDMKAAGLYSGKVNKSQLHRVDKKVFYQRKEKSDESNLAIVLLVDQSGSMGGSRILYARMACMMMYETCKALNIPLAIIGHTAASGYDEVIHRHFTDFDSKIGSEKYSLTDMSVYGNTREGVSLKYAGEFLMQRREEDKILISISDGEPQHRDRSQFYGGGLAQKDCARVVKELEGKGIKVFGVAIGDGKSGIKDIYHNNFIDIPSLNLLPAKLIGLIKKNILK